MATRTANEERDGAWVPPISPLSPTTSATLHSPEALRLEIDESTAEPFSTKFADLFDDLGFHMTESEAEDTAPPTPDHSYDIENFSNMKDIVPEWRYPDIEEIVVLSSKRRGPKGLPTILEDHGESRCSIAMPVAALSDFEFEFDAFDRPLASGKTINATICVRRDNGNKYVIKRKRAARHALWTEQTILEMLTNLETPFMSRLCWSFHSGEHIYVVTDYLPEKSLMDLVQEHGPLGTFHATLYASELVVAISSLHDAGVIHRDIEPRNIQFDSKGHIVLINFGRAEFTGVAVTGTQHSAIPSDLDGTSAVYRAPEMLLGWNQDAAVDCWSFGMLLYYMVFGMHPFGGRQGAQDDYAWVYDRVIRSAISTESLRLVHPMARDLILQCLERNPAMRWDIEKIKSHPYFTSVNWKKVSSMQTEVPTLQKAPATPSKTLSTLIHDDHRRHSSLNPLQLDHNALKRTQLPAESVQKLSASTSESPRDDTSSLIRLFAPLMCADAPALPNLFNSLTRVMADVEEDERLSASESDGHHPDINCEPRSEDANNHGNRMSQFWDDLDKEAGTSAVSINSLEFGTTTGAPYHKAPKLRKYRSAIQSRSRLFNVSTSSFQSKLQRKPRSTGALRTPRPAIEAIENLPIGIHQIGSGIGFTYNVPAAALSKISVASFAPSCHLFQRGFSVRNLGLGLGGSPSALKAKTKSVISPAASRFNGTTTINPAKESGNGTFIQDMYHSPTWILSPPDSLPSPLALVNSPASSGSGPLSPATLVDAIGEDEDCHVNITIPKNLEVDADFPLSSWAPTSTLRLVPQSPSASKLPCLDSGDTSISTCADTTA